MRSTLETYSARGSNHFPTVVSRRGAVKISSGEAIKPGKRAYSVPKLTLLADYAEGGSEPICLRD